MSKRVLILCTGNSCRSQMAEAFLKSLDADLDVYSAGTNPSKSVHPLAIQVMNELEIDLSAYHPKHVTNFLDESFDYVITVCGGAKESCPMFSGNVKIQLHIGFEDPDKISGTNKSILTGFRRIRDEIKTSFSKFYLEKLFQKVG